MEDLKLSKQELKRLSALYEYQILDTEREAIYDTITDLAKNLCEVDTSAITFVDMDSVWVKSGLEDKAFSLSKTSTPCSMVLEKGEFIEIVDTLSNNNMNQLPWVKQYDKKYYAAAPLKDDDNNILGTLCIMSSTPSQLDKRKKEGLISLADQLIKILKLRKSSMSYKTLIESSHDMIYELDENGKFLFANKSTIVKTGYGIDTLRSMTCWDLIPENEVDKVKEFYLGKIKNEEASIYYEFPIQTANGKIIWLGQSVDYTYINGVATNAYVIAKDITELVDTRLRLKETEEQILAEKTLLKTMVFSSPAAIAMFSRDLNYLAFSEKWMSDKHVNEQTIGVGDAVPSHERVELLSSIKEKILNGEVVSSESDLIEDEDGNKKWIKWVATPWNNTTDGSIGGIIIYADDVTHIVEHEKELKAAREDALASGKIKEEFLSNMSHEIRTPLNAIIGTTNLLLDENPSLKEDEKFKLLKFSSNNLLSLINNVLDFSKIESGNIILEEHNFNLKDLCSNLVNSWKPIAAKKEVDLSMKWDDAIHTVVVGDKVRLTQILNNLINNALKFTDEGFVQIKVSSKEVSNGDVLFEVKDTGVGIPKSQHEKIFQSFQQVGGEQSLERGGTGLGLPICEKLLGMMGSNLQLESSEGFGSRFFFNLKLKKGNTQEAHLESVEIDKTKLNLNVLLVEDNTANQFIAASFLEKWGVTFKIATNGEESLNYVREKNFDAVLMDIRMPVMDGPTAAKKIREMKGDYFQKLPIIALTASTILDLRKEGKGYHFDDYLAKPFNPKDFLKVLSKHAKGSADGLSHLSVDVGEKVITQRPNIKHKLEEYTEGDPEFLIEFAVNILENISTLETQLPSYFESKDVEELAELIHMVKPTLEILGQNLLVESLYQIKREWFDSNFDKNQIDDLLLEVKTVKLDLQEIIDTQSNELDKVA